MNRQVLISADDFGLSVEVNEAIEQAHRQGVLSTANLMIAGAAAEDAIQRAKRLPKLKVGLHLVVIEGPSVLPHSEIPLIVNSNNLFPSDQLRMGIDYFFKKPIQHQLRKEIRAQIQTFIDTGLVLDHIDVHKHMHLHPSVGKMLIEISKEFGVRNIRVPHEPVKTLMAIDNTTYKENIGNLLVQYWTNILKYQLRHANMRYLDWCFGLSWCGHMKFDKISKLLHNLPKGRSEIFFHPSISHSGLYQNLMPDYEPTKELEALCHPDFPKILKENNITPITWDNVH
ncbi:Chitooligosaccharide deacetylase ChbG [Commensalibacter communis]|uniref:YdjC/CelG family (ChbG) n=1 Tax=Commensalibacter communis TaxID=2972786 RepID=A0A9W4XC15_9PROT|nr:hopanoid biosynthesis-associated protein HpnK [Commensalibacter communis]CAI3922129.1 Chitooligosaccharide deacetylase ChbG [Commensalibacter communis]CAI3922556.1 Chitooligosaccharide deacetylase ChbG [Commensalibacter communis]CAI3940184.1 Chitooligosaccharide deacetylase ChbG [Commensalibacter communis]CAI3940731.1 Chitooligosaccharide deacetylase ChbG [Commensalibacter communis]